MPRSAERQATMIWKFEIEAFDRGRMLLGTHRVYAPAGMTWLSVGVQGDGNLYVWGRCPEGFTDEDDDGARAVYYFVVAGTGRPIEDETGRFLGTVQRGGLVAHVFESALKRAPAS